MTEKKEFQVNKNTPFWDASLTDQERIDWLLKEMTVEEKLGYLASSSPDLPRLGIPGVSVGGEAAHGVEGRNDQNGLGKPDVTTSFPQPIGMSASWDPELIRQAGEITGTEARVVWHRHEGHGLSRWAPTVDLERDPRWGRNEEGYGEDPVLTGKMAGAYIRGMQGDDPKYLRCAATLKHFYGNNTEVGRGWKNSSIDPRNKYELYLEPFRRCIEDGGAEGIMTAYNKINGTIGILNPEVTDILKKQYGLRHVVSDGGAMGLVVNLHHYFGQHAETIATALKAGVDAMSDDPRMVEQAAREAYELGILKEEDMDRSIRCMMETKLRLGVYDRENLNPYDRVTEDDIDSPKAREICKELSRESIVLLKNENGALPLDKALKAEDIAIVGPLGDAWYQDWYGGTAPYRTTFLQGMEVLKQENITFADGLDRVVFRCDGKGLAVAEDGTLQMADEPDVFIKEYWGEGSYTFKSVRTGKYLGARLSESQGEKPKMGQIAADREEAFDWFVMEIFHVEPQEDGSVVLTNRFHYPVYRDVEGFFSFEQTEGIPITMEVVENGIEKAVAAVRGKKQVLLALGCNSVINAKEEIDRNTLELPDEQEMLLDRIAAANPNTVLVLFTNYPYTLQKAMEKLPAIIMSATGSQDMGSAMAEAVLGIYAPAGRLNMTWYESIDQLPDIDNYDIIKGKRTYRYFDGKVLYPFGYGLTYTTFAYENYKVSLKDDRLLQISLDVRNTGDTASDEVVQIYGSALESCVKKPICQLLDFVRVKNIAPGETRHVALEIPVEELRFYDVINRRLMVEEGTYEIYAGASCKDKAVSAEIFIPGGKRGVRDLSAFTAADHYDDYENMYLTEGHFNFKAVRVQDETKEGVLVYRDCDLSDAAVLALHVKSERGGSVEAFVDSVSMGSFTGDTRTCEFRSAPKLDRYAEKEVKERNRYREPVYEDVEISLADRPQTDGASEIRLVLKGDMRICYLRVLKNKSTGKIQMGVAN